MKLSVEAAVPATVPPRSHAATPFGSSSGRWTVDARGRVCPGPLFELIGAIRGAEVGDLLAILTSDNDSRGTIPKWVRKAGHRLIAVTARAGFDEIVVEKMR